MRTSILVGPGGDPCAGLTRRARSPSVNRRHSRRGSRWRRSRARGLAECNAASGQEIIRDCSRRRLDDPACATPHSARRGSLRRRDPVAKVVGGSRRLRGQQEGGVHGFARHRLDALGVTCVETVHRTRNQLLLDGGEGPVVILSTITWRWRSPARILADAQPASARASGRRVVPDSQTPAIGSTACP
jgi:hypothetical protein